MMFLDAATVVRDEEQHVEGLEQCGRHREEVGGPDLLAVIGEEGLPPLRRRTAQRTEPVAARVSALTRSRGCVAHLGSGAHPSSGSPVTSGQSARAPPQESGASCPPARAIPAPIATPASAVPAHDGLGAHTTTAPRQLDHRPARRLQKARSPSRIVGCRSYIASCWRSARFSNSRSARVRPARRQHEPHVDIIRASRPGRGGSTAGVRRSNWLAAKNVAGQVERALCWGRNRCSSCARSAASAGPRPTTQRSSTRPSRRSRPPRRLLDSLQIGGRATTRAS